MLDRHHGWNVSFKPLVLGFVLSLLLTMAAYRLVTRYHLTSTALTLTVLGLGTAQVLIQLVFFFHLGLESKPPWNLVTFLFMVLVVIIVLGGSLWIMHNLKHYVIPTKRELLNAADRE
ncbi:MAG: Cytochrome bo(3) ubiquinol oxidase subunit 4 [Chlamydiae bacterium]|nr:Cytochrome bo(3) ubiquinol oxidase subunit 4 [Chlamydiota bacterium]